MRSPRLAVVGVGLYVAVGVAWAQGRHPAVTHGAPAASAPSASASVSASVAPPAASSSAPPASSAPAPPVIPLTDAAGSDESKRKDSPSNPEVQSTALPSVAGRTVRGYAKSGVYELGGSVSLLTGATLTQASIGPTLGYFFLDYVELSFLPQLEYAKTNASPGKTRVVLLLEPSWHVQMKGALFVFFGAGVGGAYEKSSGLGLAVAPRTGINLLVGGNGVLSAGFEYVYSASPKAPDDQKSVATTGLRAGYTIAW